MTHSRLLPVLLFALVAPLPAMAQDDIDDLDVTMEVLDSEAEVDLLINEMRGPEPSGADRSLGDELGGETQGVAETERDADPFGDAEERRDGFDRDVERAEDEIAEESDFEFDEGEDADLDELPDDDYFPDDDDDDLDD